MFHTFEALKSYICGCIPYSVFCIVVFGVATSSLHVPSHWSTSKSTPDLVQVIAVPGTGYIAMTHEYENALSMHCHVVLDVLACIGMHWG